MDGNAPQQFHDSLSGVYELAPEQREKTEEKTKAECIAEWQSDLAC